MVKKWFLGRRVFPRWKLLVLIFLGFSCGYMFDDQPYFAVIWTFFMIWDLKRKIQRYEKANTITH